MIARSFHAWERRLASVDSNRVVRPFEWGLSWLGLDDTSAHPAAAVSSFSNEALAASERFYDCPPSADYELRDGVLRFPSALETPYEANNTVVARVFPARSRTPNTPRRAVVVLPQWNADSEGHVGLCHVFARFGITAVRLSLPYHDARRPAELQRADYIVSANVGRTLQANRQAVHAQLLAILTPEQRQQLETRKAEMEKRREEFRQRRQQGQTPANKPTDN